MLAGGVLLAVGSLLVRLRRAKGLERLQFRWVVASLVLSGGGLLIAAMSGLWPLAFLCFAAIPIAIGIAVLRYRLYEIDRIISRTIAYAVVSAILAGVFVGVVLAVQAVLGPLTQSNDLAVAGSTLIVFALFAPIRRRVQRLVDRRFNRSRYDAELIVAAFARRLSDEVDLEALRSEILATVSAAVEPSSVSLWLRE